jgi:polar amino acid transport system permease protein
MMDGAALSAPVAPKPSERPQLIKAIPVRHWGRWVSAAVLLFLAFALAWSLAHNPNVGWSTIGQYLFKPLTLRGVLVTIEMTIIAMVIGIVGGTLVAVMRLSENPVLRTVAWIYIWLFRGVPLLVQIIFWGFLGALYPSLFVGIPFVGLVFAHGNTSALIGAFTAAILALGLNEVAYASELVRAGIISVDKGQQEAALSLGMSGGLTMRLVVLPQAMRVVTPPMGNETITMLKMTSLVSVISGRDLLTVVQQVYSQNFKQIPLLIVASIWYLALTTVLTIGQHYLEKRFGRGFGQADTGSAERKALKRETRNG